uniref:RRM domain-containing protein n=1 Tax=Maylandia zebra TaxID=106582 RepID=A0A3P9DUE5_9CICH
MVKIFIGNLSPDTTSDELRSLFSQYGKIAECSIVKNFEAIRNLHQYELNGQPMNVELSRGKSRGSTKLHVGNIACTNQELRAKFEEFGAVLECDIDAMEAINQLDNTAFKGELLGWPVNTQAKTGGRSLCHTENDNATCDMKYVMT